MIFLLSSILFVSLTKSLMRKVKPLLLFSIPCPLPKFVVIDWNGKRAGPWSESAAWLFIFLVTRGEIRLKWPLTLSPFPYIAMEGVSSVQMCSNFFPFVSLFLCAYMCVQKRSQCENGFRLKVYDIYWLFGSQPCHTQRYTSACRSSITRD